MAKDYKQGRLGYNSTNDRYGLLISDLWEIQGFHCGDCFEVLIEGEWVPTRIEMSLDRKWYLVDTPFEGDALEYLQVRV